MHPARPEQAPVQRRPGPRPHPGPTRGAARRALPAVLAAAGLALATLAPLALAGMSGPAAAAALAEPSRQAGGRAPFRIVALGSSSTQGTGASSPAATYPAQLQRLFDETYRGQPPVAVSNRGVAGEDIDDMLKRIGSEVVGVHPDLVIWQVGSNDPLRGVPMDRFEAELRSGIAAIRAGGSEILLMEPQWSPVIARADAKSRFVEAVREVGAEQHVAVLRRFALMGDWVATGLVTPAELIGPDNLHMTDRGYALLAKAVLAEIAGDSQAFRTRRAVTLSGHP